jgi:hypothetical protein
MPSQDDKRAPDPEGRGLSRRSLLHGAATAGAGQFPYLGVPYQGFTNPS